MTSNPNFFLDFLNRDSREIFGFFERSTTPSRLQESLLQSALNVASFFCRSHCIAPPGFFLEDESTSRFVVDSSDLFSYGLIRLPLREPSLTQFFDKKEIEYRNELDRYDGLVNEERRRRLANSSFQTVSRKSLVGAELAERWTEGPDSLLDEGLWQNVKSRLTASEMDTVQTAARQRLQNGLAVTWSGIESLLPETVSSTNRAALRRNVQHIYFGIYMAEFDLQVLRDIPRFPGSFGLESRSALTSYNTYQNVLASLGIWDLISKADAQSVVQLRLTKEHSEFLSEIARVAALQLDRGDPDFSVLYRRGPRSTLDHEVAELVTKTRNQQGDGPRWRIDSRGLTRVQEVLGVAVQRARSASAESWPNLRSAGLLSPYGKVRPVGSSSELTLHENDWVLVFVALHEELESIKRVWTLSHQDQDPMWMGTVQGVQIGVLCPDRPGRVQAAIHVSKIVLSAETPPALIVVLGIAGGFGDSRQGDILTPSVVKDLSLRKIHQDSQGGKESRLRPAQFTVNQRLNAYVRSGSFPKGFLADTASEFEYPAGTVPVLRRDDLASGDEVIASEQYVSDLLEQDSKLMGVDMESGGVCAVAEQQRIPTWVVRGVSDRADMAKTDDHWRAKSIRVAARLVETAIAQISCVEGQPLLTEGERGQLPLARVWRPDS